MKPAKTVNTIQYEDKTPDGNWKLQPVIFIRNFKEVGEHIDTYVKCSTEANVSNNHEKSNSTTI